MVEVRARQDSTGPTPLHGVDQVANRRLTHDPVPQAQDVEHPNLPTGEYRVNDGKRGVCGQMLTEFHQEYNIDPSSCECRACLRGQIHAWRQVAIDLVPAPPDGGADTEEGGL